MEVSVGKYVEQIVNGKRYKGWVKIKRVQFNYELVFGVPISELNKIKPAETETEVRRIFQLTVHRDGKKIELEEIEYAFFLIMIVDFIVEFYNNPQTQENNEPLGFLVAYSETFSKLDISPSIGMGCRESYNLSNVFCKMLSNPKFGCIF